ncbi:MAG: hypothetical protein ABEJ91_03330 [Candidatus Nanohaloarchaea archaeon]
MNYRKKLSQYSVLIVGLLIGGGFAFGGIASYSGVASGGSSGSGGQQGAPELPESNVVEGGFNLTLREQAFLAYENDVVFVTVLEGNRTVELDRQAIVSDFNSRVYITSQDASTSTLTARLRDPGIPVAIAVSAVVSNRQLQPRLVQAEPNRESIGSAVCDAMRNWGSVAAKCVSR